MKSGMKIITVAAATLALAACSSVPVRTGTAYECDRGTRLNVDYVRDGAIVRVNGGRTMVLRSSPSNGGEVYENKMGARLNRQGNQVMWNTALRSAAESCHVVMRPL